MEFSEIREEISSEMGYNCDEQWFNILADTSPGHYGVERIYFQSTRIWIDIQQRTFTFSGGLSFSARLGSSRDEDSVDEKFRKSVKGSGKFEFKSGNKIEVLNFDVDEPIDLF